MKNLKCLVLLLAVSAFFVACGGGAKNMASQAASDMCECSKPGVEFQKKVEAAGTDAEKLAALSAEGTKVATETTACMEKLQAKYGEKRDDEKFEDAVMAALKTQCPEVHSMMGGE